ncbi:MAG: hypothetical protein FJ096_02040 [Deltaproteobacteria bacterium]|nr:hypothetical protein [Deltaproteobacteria bacterium]
MGVVTCDGSEPRVTEGFLARARFGATAGATGASLRFSPADGSAPANATLVHRMSTAFVEWRPARRWSLALGLGALAGGRLSIDWTRGAERGALLPGVLATATGSYLIALEGARSPFVLAGLTFGVGAERFVRDGAASSEPMTALDLRASLTLGKTFAERLRPYVAVRAFGGPAMLGERAVGSDRYHLQIGGGLAVVLPRGFDIFVDASPGPERAASFGLGFAPGR